MDSTLTYVSPPCNWLSDHVPTASEIPNSGAITIYDLALDTTTNNNYICIDATPDALVWNQYVSFVASGNATLSTGSVTVSCPSLVIGQKIRLLYSVPGLNPGAIYVSNINPGTGFTISSTNILDDSTIYWEISN